ncbi:ribose-phosphate pyrophosphokinase [Polymorphobacter sp.]|uniref:ribose-phosphate pyrophosphokinase n=1 Tax=Polymorphobacter sp. TaxID=1909290 RepID=UPI003F6F4A1D
MSFDPDHVEALLHTAAAARTPLTYAETLAALGHPFSRPRMRALCRLLEEVDRRADAANTPKLAVLVVRASDGLPGQGWWVGRTDWHGPWQGPEAHAHVARLQMMAFDHWAKAER